MNPWIISISIAYLLGSIPFGYLLVRIFRNEDIRAQGSGNIGATNVARSGAKGLGLATLLLDLGKGYAAVKIAQHIAPRECMTWRWRRQWRRWWGMYFRCGWGFAGVRAWPLRWACSWR